MFELQLASCPRTGANKKGQICSKSSRDIRAGSAAVVIALMGQADTMEGAGWIGCLPAESSEILATRVSLELTKRICSQLPSDSLP